MAVTARSTLVQFSKKHSDALVALLEWYDMVIAADWKSVADVRSFSNTVDYVGNERFVFNIKGN